MNQNFRMIDVGYKEITHRKAVAVGSIYLSPITLEMIKKRESPKGDILAMAEVAGIMAAKNTSHLLPLCHPLLLNSVKVWFEIKEQHVDCFCEVTCDAKTGVEMEALVGVNISLLTVYDLAKAVDPTIEIQNIYLRTKEGGKSGLWMHPKAEPAEEKVTKKVELNGLRFSVGTLSDRASQGTYEDKSGMILRQFFTEAGATEVFCRVIPDDKDLLEKLVMEVCELRSDVLLLTGGTGISKRDITPEVVKSLASKELIGFGELQRQYGAKYTKLSWLSRSSAYVVKETLVILFPGNPKAVQQGLEGIADLIGHAVRMMKGDSHA